jgi:cytoskeletal protein CcmA (bactofilin family)
MLGRSNKDSERFPDDRDIPAKPTPTPTPTPTPKSTPPKKEGRRMMDDLSSPKDMNTFIAKGSEFVGKLTFEGTVRVDGKVDGEIFSKGTLFIGANADIKAKINVDTVIIAGNVNGNVTARQKIEMRSPAKLTGNISTPSLVIEEGVIFEGNCKMDASNAAKAEAPTPSRPEPKPQTELKVDNSADSDD